MSRREMVIIEDDFDAMAEFGRQNRGGDAPQEHLTPWQMLSRGKTIGKSVVVDLQSGGGLGTSSVDVLMLSADDDAALPLSVLLSPPRVAPGVTVTSATIQNLSGTQYVKDAAVGSGFANAGNPFARIEWGVGGVSNQVDVDIHQGAMLSLIASFIRIKAFVGDPPNTVTSCPYQLSAFVGPGRDKGLGAQRTIEAPNYPAVNVQSAQLAVPNFARRVRLCGWVNAGGFGDFVGVLRFYRSPNTNTTYPMCDYLFAANTPDSFPIPLGAYGFTFIPLVANVTAMHAIFDLAV